MISFSLQEENSRAYGYYGFSFFCNEPLMPSTSKDVSIITLSSLFMRWQDKRNSCRRRKQKTYSYRNFCRATWIRPKRPNECDQHQLYRRQVWAYLEIFQTLVRKYLALLLCEYDNDFFFKKRIKIKTNSSPLLFVTRHIQ